MKDIVDRLKMTSDLAGGAFRDGADEILRLREKAEQVTKYCEQLEERVDLLRRESETGCYTDGAKEWNRLRYAIGAIYFGRVSDVAEFCNAVLNGEEDGFVLEDDGAFEYEARRRES